VNIKFSIGVSQVSELLVIILVSFELSISSCAIHNGLGKEVPGTNTLISPSSVYGCWIGGIKYLTARGEEK